HKVTIDAVLDLLHAQLHLFAGETPVPVVDGLELAAIHGDDRLGEQVKPAAQVNKLTADTTDCFAIVTAKVGNRFEVRHQPGSQPHQLDIALCFHFKAPRRLNAIQVAINVELEKRGRIISGAACSLRFNAFKPERASIKLIDENINYAHRIVLGDIIVQQFGKQRTLGSVFTLNKAWHTSSSTLHAIRI